MKNNKTVDTAQKGQTANKIQPEKVQNSLKKIQEIRDAKKDKTPTGKVITISEKESKRKAREEQYRNFRINALKRRAERMHLSKQEIEEAVKKLKEQMDAPKEYNILIMVAKPDVAMLKEALAKEGIKYAFCGDDFVSVNGNQDVLAKMREIAPPSAKIYPHAKKMESILPKQTVQKVKKPTNNTKEKKSAASSATKIYGGSNRYSKRQKGRIYNLMEIRRASRFVKKNLKKGEKIDVKKVFKVVEERKKRGTATTVQLKAKKSSTGSKKASTSIKKAA